MLGSCLSFWLEAPIGLQTNSYIYRWHIIVEIKGIGVGDNYCTQWNTASTRITSHSQHSWVPVPPPPRPLPDFPGWQVHERSLWPLPCVPLQSSPSSSLTVPAEQGWSLVCPLPPAVTAPSPCMFAACLCTCKRVRWWVCGKGRCVFSYSQTANGNKLSRQITTGLQGHTCNYTHYCSNNLLDNRIKFSNGRYCKHKYMYMHACLHRWTQNTCMYTLTHRFSHSNLQPYYLFFLGTFFSLLSDLGDFLKEFVHCLRCKWPTFEVLNFQLLSKRVDFAITVPDPALVVLEEGGITAKCNPTKLFTYLGTL